MRPGLPAQPRHQGAHIARLWGTPRLRGRSRSATALTLAGERLPTMRSSNPRGGRTKLPFGGVVVYHRAGDTAAGRWAAPTMGSGSSRNSRVGRTGTGVWQGRTADGSNRCASWPPAIALPGRQGRSSRRRPARIPGGDRLAISAARLAGVALPLFRDDRRVGAASVWVVLGARRRLMTGASAASWPRAAAGSRRTTGSSARMRPDARKTIFRLSLGCDWHRPRDGGTGRA